MAITAYDAVKNENIFSFINLSDAINFKCKGILPSSGYYKFSPGSVKKLYVDETASQSIPQPIMKARPLIDYNASPMPYYYMSNGNAIGRPQRGSCSLSPTPPQPPKPPNNNPTPPQPPNNQSEGILDSPIKLGIIVGIGLVAYNLFFSKKGKKRR